MRANVRDAVWGEVTFADDEWSVVKTAAFQRLRRIHQLGLTMLIFPGATHTRWEHSIGTMHAAGRLAHQVKASDTVKLGDSDVGLIRMAALVHDLGHGPFSHVADHFLGKKGHEWIGSMILERDPELATAIPEETRERIAKLLREEKRRSVERDIVSGPADADKMDYLLRDSHFTGVRQGVFDYERLIDQAVGIDMHPESMLGFRAGGLWAIEGMLLARHHMHRTVYGHRNRWVTDFMLQRGISAALGNALPQTLLTLPDADVFDDWYDVFRRWDDGQVIAACLAADGVARRMFERLRDHRLLKLQAFVEDDDLKEALGVVASRALVEHPLTDEIRAVIEADLAKVFDWDPADVIVRIEEPKGLLREGGLTAGPDEIMLIKPFSDPADPRQYQEFYLRSEIFSALPAPRWRRQLLVYTPVSMSSNLGLSRKVEERTIAQVKEQLDRNG
jgi:HD superfamily phosphohydrolase